MKFSSRITLILSLILCFVVGATFAGPMVSSVELKSFSLSFNNLVISENTPTTLTVNWSAATNGLPTPYFVSAHIFPASSTSLIPTDANRFLQRSCDLSVFTCNDLRVEQCTFNSAHRLSCSAGTGVILSPGAYSIVARACIHDVSDNMKEVCSSKKSSLVVQ